MTMDKWLILAQGKCPHCGREYELLMRQSVFKTCREKAYFNLRYGNEKYAPLCQRCGQYFKPEFEIFEPPIVKRPVPPITYIY